ncbi:hypothetical protein WR25_08256 [Diploscapter pachys]|uniref:BSD domain-containing protein n=1 Tax=Diploscapter pachys TaxID=2018661 RepID=A0A2A2LHN4_9BILA|nr:hypothetical protein WR25_08256 [Diploscapter pachys]
MASWFGDIKKKLQDTVSAIEQQMKAENSDDSEQQQVVAEEKPKLENSEPKPENEENPENADEEKQEEVAFAGGKGLLSGFDAGKFLKDTTAFATKQLEVVKTAVIDKSMLGELNRDQTEFERQLEEEKKKNDSVTLPWEGLSDENLAKKKILALSLDSRNFLRDSPGDSEFSAQQQEAMAAKLIGVDSNLGKVRFQLVPKKLTEQKFWSNYFYRVGLIRQSILMNEPVRTSKTPEPQPPAENCETSTATAPTTSNETVTGKEEKVEEKVESPDENTKNAENSPLEEDWETEILADLDSEKIQEKTGGKNDEEWESELQDLLNGSE